MPLAPFISVPKRDRSGNVIFGPDGKPVMGIIPNPPKAHVRGYWLVPTPVADVAVTVAAGGSAELHFIIDTQGHFDWAYIIGTSTAPYTLDFFDAGSNRRLQNQPIHSTTIVGSAKRPFRLPEPYFFNVGDSQRDLIVTVRNVVPVTAENVIRLALYGRRFYHKEAPPQVAKDLAEQFGGGWRTYSYFLTPKETKADGTVTAVAASGIASFTFDMDRNADTDLHKLMVASTGAFKFTIRERATNRFIMNGEVHSAMGWGNAEFPFYFADSYLLERDKQLLVDVTDLSAAENSIYLTMAGKRLQYV